MTYYRGTGFRAEPGYRALSWQGRMVEQGKGILAVVASGDNELVEDTRFLRARGNHVMR